MSISLFVSTTTENLQGKSHWWGAPDFPAGMRYPFVEIDEGIEEPLTFVCQIRCEGIAPYDTTGLLPTKGMLYVFAPLAYFMGGYGRGIGSGYKPLIIHIEDCSELYPCDIVSPKDHKSIFRPAHKITFENNFDEKIVYGATMLCPPDRDNIEAYNSGHIVLLQIEECSEWGLHIYDCGSYYILMRPEDIKNGNWNEVRSDTFTY